MVLHPKVRTPHQLCELVPFAFSAAADMHTPQQLRLLQPHTNTLTDLHATPQRYLVVFPCEERTLWGVTLQVLPDKRPAGLITQFSGSIEIESRLASCRGRLETASAATASLLRCCNSTQLHKCRQRRSPLHIAHLPMYMPRVVDMLRPCSWLTSKPLLPLLLLPVALLPPLLLLLPNPPSPVRPNRLRACCCMHPPVV